MLKTRDPVERSDSEENSCAYSNCLLKRVDGSDYCQVHGAHTQIQSQNKKNLYDFQRSQYLAFDKKRHANYKYDVSEELGVTRGILQRYLDKVEDDTTLALYNSQINQQIDRIQKLVESTLKADQKLGTLMSEEDTIAIANGLLETVHTVLSEHIKNQKEFSDAMKHLGKKFGEIIAARSEVQ
jgi:predicted transcriptional regulator